MLIDGRGRRYLLTLTPGASFHTHAGGIQHDEMIGREEGIRLTSSNGARLIAVRPTLNDFILKMPRGAQVVYPKDIATIVMGADIGPEMTVLEAGTGSGALTLGLLRAVGRGGRVITYERRPEFAARARENIEAFLGALPEGLMMRAGEVGTHPFDEEVDRVVLDLAEPWNIVPLVTGCLRPGGIFCSYVPTIPQVQQATTALRRARFVDIVTTETLVRPWKIEGSSVRPDHRMVAHTGFVTVARWLHHGARPADDPGA